MVAASACGSGGSDDSTGLGDDTGSTPRTAASTSTAPADVRMSPLELQLSSGGGDANTVAVTVTLTNSSADAVTVVRPVAPYYFVRFEVTDGEASLPYLGELAKLQPLADEFFAELGPGESISEEIDLQTYYRLPVGSYAVSAEYVNPEFGPHEGTRALTFEIGDGPRSASIDLDVSA